MDAILSEMIDHYAITKLIGEYCHGCDRYDAVQMSSVYLDDAWDDHGTHKMNGKEFAHVSTATMAETVNNCSHHLGQSLIHVSGDIAGAETYFIATLRYPAEDGIERLNQIGGRYVDELVRANGVWRVKRRICVRDWSISHKIAEDWVGDAPFVQGVGSGEDVSYAVLGFKHSGIPSVSRTQVAGKKS